MQRRMEGAERISDFYFAGDYTYRHLQNAGPRWLLIGDAAGFIDPIFSSGVMLAIKSGYRAAPRSARGGPGGPAAQRACPGPLYPRRGQMCKVFLNMIRMFTTTTASRSS
ncbi:MAG: hypothetical protein WDN28_20600 [Chthoniobacter sp.]